MRYIITENVISTAALYIILKKLMTPFEQWDAFKLGIIDKDGKKLKTPITSSERAAWDLLSVFCCNFKKVITRFIGKSNWVTNLTMAYLLKDHLDYFYINHNKEVLHETYLNDLTITKQNQLNQFIKKIESKYGKEVVTEENIEVLYIKYSKIIEKEIDSLKNIL